MGRERQIRKQEEVRNKILDVARDIVSREGIKGLSIRKITNAIDYSPASIYHYFKDKNEIIESLVMEGYGQILNSIRSVKKNENEPEKELKEVFTNYIRAALDSPEVYKAFMLSNETSVLEKTALLHRGVSKNSQTIKMLCDNINRGIEKGHYESHDLELTAQIIWTSTFGLIIKLITEKDIPEEQRNRLVEHHFNILFNGILK